MSVYTPEMEAKIAAQRKLDKTLTLVASGRPVDAAIAYAQLGWYVFPVEPGGKRPIGSLVPHGKDDATIDETTIRSWWQQFPDANVGISVAPSGLVVLDIDTANGKPGAKSLVDLGQLPDTLTAQTGSGGAHVIFSRPEGVAMAQRIGLRPGLDLIGNGYIVAPPSLHASGNRYQWADRNPIARLPQLLIEASAPRPVPTNTSADDTHEPITEGGRNAGLTALAGRLRHAGLDQEPIALALLATNRQRCKPPMPDAEVEGIARSVSRYPATNDVAGDAALSAALVAASAPSTGSLPPLACDALAIDRPPLITYSTGIDELDQRLGGGITTRSQSVVVARTGAGKSGLAINIAIHIMHTYGIPVLYISSELEIDECSMRFAANLLDVSIRDLLNGHIPRERAREALSNHPIHIVDADAINDRSVCRDDEGIAEGRLRVLANAIAHITDRYGKRPLVIADYLQELADPDPRNVRMGVSGMARALRVISQRYDLCVFAVSSTGRAFYRQPKEGADDPLTYLGAAKESGDIEFAVVNLLYLDVATEPVNGVFPARIVVAKARRGTLGFVGASFHGPSGRWTANEQAAAALSGPHRKKRGEEADKDLMRAEIENAARAGDFRTKAAWRGKPLGQRRSDAAIDALIKNGSVVQVDKMDPRAHRIVQVIAPRELQPESAAVVMTADPAIAGWAKP